MLGRSRANAWSRTFEASLTRRYRTRSCELLGWIEASGAQLMKLKLFDGNLTVWLYTLVRPNAALQQGYSF